jgi:nucleotide-binding universal stress UspA family protein
MPWTHSKHSVLVPWDFSVASRSALAVARELADEPGHITVLHVVTPPLPTTPGIVWGAYDEPDLLEKALAALRAELDAAGEPQVRATVALGDPSREIARCAAEIHAELVVIPSHSRRGVERWLLGSVAERVVRFAPCPVLVLRETG